MSAAPPRFDSGLPVPLRFPFCFRTVLFSALPPNPLSMSPSAPIFMQSSMHQGTSNATARTSIATATDGIGIPNEKHLAQAKTTLPRTSPVYGRFDAPHCAKWLIYGIRFPKTRVSLLEFRHPYLENRS